MPFLHPSQNIHLRSTTEVIKVQRKKTPFLLLFPFLDGHEGEIRKGRERGKKALSVPTREHATNCETFIACL